MADALVEMNMFYRYAPSCPAEESSGVIGGQV